MSADDLSASGRWARDPYVQALEEQLKKLGFKVYTPASYVFLHAAMAYTPTPSRGDR